MAGLAALIGKGVAVEHHRPFPRATVSAEVWSDACERLRRGELCLLGLWGERDRVHMALFDGDDAEIAVISLDCPDDGRYPSVGLHHPPALRLERAARDLYGLQPEGLPDPRPWLDHGRWDRSRPLGPSPTAPIASSYPFLPIDGEGLHQIPVGPVHAGIIEPGHFRFTANGETVVRLEERLGYVHKGIEGLMAGANLERAAKLAARTCGDSTVAYGLAFARAVEEAVGLEPPPRAIWLRAVMAELERMANHLGDFGAIANDASFSLLHAHTAMLREKTLRAADSAFGHRLMRDRIVPGGVAGDVDATGIAALEMLVGDIGARLPELVELYDNTATLQDRTVTTGFLRPDLTRQYAAGGYVGRASGRSFDARKQPGYSPYDRLKFEVPSLDGGDVNARVWIRIKEIGESLSMLDELLDGLPGGPLSRELPQPSEPREGMALVEGFRGDILVWLRLDPDRTIARCHLRDPSWFQWPLLEAAIEGNIVADFPLCNKSFNCSYSGHDL
jgi:Ni,Fe-hydrogenase III large subunit